MGRDRDAYGNAAAQINTDELYMKEWRKQGPSGMLIDVINYIKIPQQYELLRDFQCAANARLPAGERFKVLEPVKPAVTRWNWYYAAVQALLNYKLPTTYTQSTILVGSLLTIGAQSSITINGQTLRIRQDQQGLQPLIGQ